MKKRQAQKSRYYCAICNKSIKKAHQAYVREDKIGDVRVCYKHARMLEKYYGLGPFISLKLAFIKRELRILGHRAPKPSIFMDEGFSKEESHKILSRIAS